MITIEISKLPIQAQVELNDFYEFLLKKHTLQPTENHTPSHEATPLGQLAVTLFGTEAGVELELSRHTPHSPMGF